MTNSVANVLCCEKEAQVFHETILEEMKRLVDEVKTLAKEKCSAEDKQPGNDIKV